MSVQPANDCDCPTFNSTCFIGEVGSGSFSSGQISYLQANYLQYPTAQGDNTLTNVNATSLTATGRIECNSFEAIAGIATDEFIAYSVQTTDLYATGQMNGLKLEPTLITNNLEIANTQSTGTLSIAGLSTRSASISVGSLTNTSAITIAGQSIKLGINGSYGTAGQVLTSGGSGSMTWTTGGGGSSVQSGETPAITATSGTVSYTTSFATKPNVVLSYNTNGTTIFIPIGLSSHTIVGGLYTGFTWASASTSATGTITWFSTL